MCYAQTLTLSWSIYHVMLRGNYKKLIFFDDNNRYKFHELLESITLKYHCKIHLFCLMTNHVYMVIEVRHAPLSKSMQSLVSHYTKYINHILKKNGRLFQ